MKDSVGFVILIVCFLLALMSLRSKDVVIGLVSCGLFLIGSKLFRY